MSESEKRDTDAFVPLGQAGIPKADVDRQLQKLLHSETLENQGAKKKLLEHLVQESVAGNTARLRVAEITKALFRRYDRGDSRVRVDAGKLRTFLDTYYAAEAEPGEIRFTIPERQYGVYAPRAAGASTEERTGESSVPAIGRILEPGVRADVNHRITARGRIDSLDPDLRPWLIVRTSYGVLRPMGRVSRKRPEWEVEALIGSAPIGGDDGYLFELVLLAADVEGDALFHEYLKNGEDDFGKELPATCVVMDRRPVVRRDIREPR